MPPPAGALVVVVGDSLSTGYGALVQQIPWPTQYTALQTADTVNNQAIDGHSTLNWQGEVATINALYAAGAILPLLIGTNDLSEGRNGATVYSDIVSLCNAFNAGFKIILCNIPERGDIDNTQRLALNSALLAGWAGFAEAFVDIATPLGNRTSNPTYWQSDDTHPTTLGGGVIAAAVSAARAGL